MSRLVVHGVVIAWASIMAAHAECALAPLGSDGAVRISRPIAAEYPVVGGFGFRRHPMLAIMRRHEGIDYAAPVGVPVTTAARGEIVEARRNGEFGNYVLVRHRDGVETEYAQLSKFAPGMAPGRCVGDGEVIGYVGNTGMSTGPHLHMGLRINGSLVDPAPYIQGVAPGQP